MNTQIISKCEDFPAPQLSYDALITALNNISDIRQKIKHIRHIFYQWHHLEASKCKQIVCTHKNIQHSAKKQIKGIKTFENKQFKQAMICFNKSLCFAPVTSKQLSFAYANRAAVCFRKKMYESCLLNIKLAQNAGLPMELNEMISFNAIECIANGSKQCHLEKVPTIRNCVADCLEWDGTDIRTTVDLVPGQVVGIDNSVICNFLTTDREYRCCHHCYKPNVYILIPCQYCTCVMFCDEKCRSIAWTLYHKYECPIIDYIIDDLHLQQRIALRATLIAIYEFGSIANIKTFMDYYDRADINIFTISKFDFPPNTTKKQKEFLYCYLIPSNILKTMPFHFYVSIGHMVSNIMIKLKTYTAINEKIREPIESQILYDILFNCCIVAMCGIESEMQTTNIENQQHGIFPLYNLLTQSTDPNIICLGDIEKYIIVLRPIKSGEPLHINTTE